MEKTTFVPVLSVSSGVTDISFYHKAFGAEQQWRLNNPDGTVHVAAFLINGAPFRLHEEGNTTTSPAQTGSTTVTIGLDVDDVHAVVNRAVAAGAVLSLPVTDYEYGYRQAQVTDPFGHRWEIEKLINPDALKAFIDNAG